MPGKDQLQGAGLIDPAASADQARPDGGRACRSAARRRTNFSPYRDAPEEGIEVLAYDYIEAFAEKFRALAERTRPRDLYDVVNLYRNGEARPEPRRSSRYCAPSANSRASAFRA